MLKSFKVLLWTVVLALIASIFIFFRQGFSNIETPFQAQLSYQDVLETDITPTLPPEHEFPTSYQYLNGCYGFSVGHILMDRGWEFDMLDMEARIKKPREVLWKKEYKERLEKEYNLEFKYSKNPELLFKLLSQGEGVVVGYKYPLGEGDWVLHAVAAYSFDEEGIWVSDSLAGDNIRIPYEKIFTKDGLKTRYWFTQVVEL